MKKVQWSKYIPYMALLVLIVVGAFLSPSFLSFKNFSNVIQYAAETGMIAVGMTMVILIGGIDLSVGATAAFTCVVTAALQAAGVGVVPCLVIAIAIGVGIGSANGVIITKAKVEPFMGTLVMQLIMRALTLWFTNGGPIISGVTDELMMFARSSVFEIPLPAIYVIVTFVACGIVLNKTPFGRHIYAVGGSEETSKLFGIRVDFTKIMVYIISSALAAFAGFLITARIGIGEPRSGADYDMTAISMVIVGGASLSGGKGTIQGTFVGLMIISILMNLMNLMNINANVQPIVRGVIILLTALVISGEGVSARKKAQKAQAS